MGILVYHIEKALKGLRKVAVLAHILEKAQLTFKMGLFGATHGYGGGSKKARLPNICHTYPTMMKLGTLLPCLKKI